MLFMAFHLCLFSGMLQQLSQFVQLQLSRWKVPIDCGQARSSLYLKTFSFLFTTGTPFLFLSSSSSSLSSFFPSSSSPSASFPPVLSSTPAPPLPPPSRRAKALSCHWHSVCRRRSWSLLMSENLKTLEHQLMKYLQLESNFCPHPPPFLSTLREGLCSGTSVNQV